MPVESATYISDLNASNPEAADAKSQGDDHLRLIKSAVKATFPNVAGAVTPTHTELNYVDGVTSAIQTQLNAKAALAGGAFTGDTSVTTDNGTEARFSLVQTAQRQYRFRIPASQTHLALSDVDGGNDVMTFRSNGNVGVGTAAADVTDRVHVTGSIKLTANIKFVGQAADPSSPEAGWVYYNSSTNKLRCYNGSSWNDLF